MCVRVCAFWVVFYTLMNMSWRVKKGWKLKQRTLFCGDVSAPCQRSADTPSCCPWCWLRSLHTTELSLTRTYFIVFIWLFLFFHPQTLGVCMGTQLILVGFIIWVSVKIHRGLGGAWNYQEIWLPWVTPCRHPGSQWLCWCPLCLQMKMMLLLVMTVGTKQINQMEFHLCTDLI